MKERTVLEEIAALGGLSGKAHVWGSLEGRAGDHTLQTARTGSDGPGKPPLDMILKNGVYYIGAPIGNSSRYSRLRADTHAGRMLKTLLGNRDRVLTTSQLEILSKFRGNTAHLALGTLRNKLQYSRAVSLRSGGHEGYYCLSSLDENSNPATPTIDGQWGGVHKCGRIYFFGEPLSDAAINEETRTGKIFSALIERLNTYVPERFLVSRARTAVTRLIPTHLGRPTEPSPVEYSINSIASKLRLVSGMALKQEGNSYGLFLSN